MNENKKVVCLMVTYGRFTLVERSISFFLAQTYQNKELIIYTEADTPLDGTNLPSNIKVINEPGRKYNGLWEIYEEVMKYCEGDQFISWDDDNIYFPSFISELMAVKEKKGIKPDWSYFGNTGRVDRCCNILEPSIIVDMDLVKRIGFRKHGIQFHLDWHDWLINNNEMQFYKMDVSPFLYTWGEREIPTHKVSGNPNNPKNFEDHKAGSVNFGTRPLEVTDSMIWYRKFADMLPELKTKLNL